MYLFFNGVSKSGYIGLYSARKTCIAYESVEISGNESTKLIALIDNFLQQQGVQYSEIRNIACVVGPGSFTGVRTISLVVNTLSYIYPRLHLTPINFFDLYVNYPIVKGSSKRDLFVKHKKNATITVLSNKDFEKNVASEKLYGDIDTQRFEKHYTLHTDVDYEEFFKNLKLQEKKQIAPLYIKKPNIS